MRCRVVIVYRRFGTSIGLLTLEDGTATLSRNVGKQLTPRDIPEDRRSHQHRDGD
jgi:hypothetical protein